MKRFAGVAIFLAFLMSSVALAADNCPCCQEITYRFGGDERVIVKWADLDAVPVDEIYRAVLFLNAIENSGGAKDLKLEILKRLAPNLYERNIKNRE